MGTEGRAGARTRALSETAAVRGARTGRAASFPTVHTGRIEGGGAGAVAALSGETSVAGSAVRVYYNVSLSAGPMSEGWTRICETELSANGGNDTLVPPGELKTGLYLIEYDFEGVNAAARQIYKKDPSTGEFTQLNPNGFFLAPKSSITLKVEDASTFNHVVISVGEKEITIRPGVRQH